MAGNRVLSRRSGPLTRFGETRMLSEYVSAQYPGAEAFFRVRLGPLTTLADSRGLTDEERAMLGSFRRWADVVVVTPRELIVIEGKMRAKPDALGQLRLYRGLLLQTPELARFLDRPVALELVVAIEDPAVSRIAGEFGVRVRIYKPSWLAEWLAEVRPRERRSSQDLESAPPGP